jgi:uncharacterized transporter YbjL
MRWLIEMLRHYLQVEVFFILAVGFATGAIKFGKFSLGHVTCVLLTGVLIGQITSSISPDVKAVFS